MASILVVEDDPTIRELVRLHLASASHDVMTASDGLQGLQMAVSNRPDVIVSDVQMPNMDGFGMLAAVRANEQTSSIPVIFLTALDDRENFRKSMNLGADDFLSKPVKARRVAQCDYRPPQTRRESAPVGPVAGRHAAFGVRIGRVAGSCRPKRPDFLKSGFER